MVRSKFHGIVDVRLNLGICHMKGFINTFSSLYVTAHDETAVQKNLLNPHIGQSLLCYIEP